VLLLNEDDRYQVQVQDIGLVNVKNDGEGSRRRRRGCGSDGERLSSFRVLK
jgi:hypothetical protein